MHFLLIKYLIIDDYDEMVQLRHQTLMEANISQNHLEEMIVHLSELKIDFIIAGGVAVVLHGVDRATMDIDLAVDLSPENLNLFVDAMKSMGLVPRAPVSHEFIKDPENIRDIVENKNALVFTFFDPDSPFKQIDMFLIKELSYKSLISHTEKFDIGGHSVDVLSKEKIIALKKLVKPPREKDLYDITQLTKLLEK
jgi:hypothetical protein